LASRGGPQDGGYLAAERELDRETLAPAFRDAVASARATGDRPALRAMTKARRQAARELPVDGPTAAALPAALAVAVREWNRLLLGRASTITAGHAMFEKELAERRAELRAVLARPDVREGFAAVQSRRPRGRAALPGRPSPQYRGDTQA